MTIDLHKRTFADREALMALCNAVDRTFLSDRSFGDMGPGQYSGAQLDCSIRKPRAGNLAQRVSVYVLSSNRTANQLW